MKYQRIFKSIESGKSDFCRKADNEIKTDMRICVANRIPYENGHDEGYTEWITLPVEDDGKAVLERIGVSDYPDEEGNVHDEYIIIDYDAPFTIDKQDSIKDLNEVARMLAKFNDTEKRLFTRLVEEDERIEPVDVYGAESLCDLINDKKYTLYVAYAPLDLAYVMIDRQGGINKLDEEILDAFFDYRAYGKYLERQGYKRLGDDEHYYYIDGY